MMVHETYNQLGQISNRIADWLRERGYAAHAGHPLGGMALYPPMAQEAGLGWRGISGLVITPEYGPRSGWLRCSLRSKTCRSMKAMNMPGCWTSVNPANAAFGIARLMRFTMSRSNTITD